jgi:glycosyltransferase involved in cell wall biosynthesis
MLIELVRQPFRRRELGSAGRETMERFYTWKTIASQLEAYLAEIAHQSSVSMQQRER